MMPHPTARRTLSAPVLALVLVAAGLPGVAAGAPETSRADPTGEELAEVSVTGERPGPGLWRVVNGDRTLYILGTLRPLPEKITWRSREVEQVIARSQLVIPETADVQADVGPIRAVKLYAQWRKVRKNADGATLADVLPPDLHARFEALRARHAPRERGMLKLRPLLAAGKLWDESLEHAGLTLRVGVNAQVRRLARRSQVPLAEPRLKLEEPQALLAELGQIPLEAEIACVAATLDRLESDLANARMLADAWATGDVAVIRAQEEWQHEQACWGALTASPRFAEFRRKLDDVWFDEAVRALETHETALAVASMPALLKPGGLLERLAARGYEVIEP